MICSVDSRLLFLHCRLMSASLNGGDKTVIFDGSSVMDIAVLHGECGSSGKTNKLTFAWCCGFHMFAFISPRHNMIIYLGYPRALFPSFISGCTGLLTFASFTFAYLYYHGLRYTKEMDKYIWLII